MEVASLADALVAALSGNGTTPSGGGLKRDGMLLLAPFVGHVLRGATGTEGPLFTAVDTALAEIIEWLRDGPHAAHFCPAEPPPNTTTALVDFRTDPVVALIRNATRFLTSHGDAENTLVDVLIWRLLNITPGEALAIPPLSLSYEDSMLGSVHMGLSSTKVSGLDEMFELSLFESDDSQPTLLHHSFGVGSERSPNPNPDPGHDHGHSHAHSQFGPGVSCQSPHPAVRLNSRLAIKFGEPGPTDLQGQPGLPKLEEVGWLPGAERAVVAAAAASPDESTQAAVRAVATAASEDNTHVFDVCLTVHALVTHLSTRYADRGSDPDPGPDPSEHQYADKGSDPGHRVGS